jgi:hypothetical protein
VEGVARRPFNLTGMVETDYEDLSFVVAQEGPDGWLQFRFGAPTERDGGLAWLHRDHLTVGSLPLQFERWQERFTSDEISPLYLRTVGPWTLRSAPSEGADVLGPIVVGHAIEPLEFNGAWLRIRVRQPSDYCGEATDVRVSEGWIRWWDAEIGPLVWYHTRGC